MNTFLIAGLDPIGGPPKPHVFVRQNGAILAVDVTSEEDRRKAFGEDAERLYQEEFRFCAVWQDGWTWEQFCLEAKRLAAEKEVYKDPAMQTTERIIDTWKMLGERYQQEADKATDEERRKEWQARADEMKQKITEASQPNA